VIRKFNARKGLSIEKLIYGACLCWCTCFKVC